MRRLLILAALAAIPVVAGAQRARTDDERASSRVPVSMLPPAGKCRIWMIGVAPAQQPAPTDCQTALRQRPANGVVVFGPVEREESTNGFRGRPSVEQGPEDRPRSTAGETRTENRTEPRTPTPDPRRESPARPPTRPPAEDPVKKPATERPPVERPPVERPPEERPPRDADNSAIIGALVAVMTSESSS